MTIASKAMLLTMFAPKVANKEVEHGGQTASICIRELSAAQVFELQEQHKDHKDDRKGFMVSLVSSCLCDEEGKLLMTTAEANELLSINVQAFNKLAEAVAEAVGIGKKEEEGKA